MNKRNLTVAALMIFASACVIGLVAVAYAPPDHDTQFTQNALYGLAGVAIGIVGGLVRGGPTNEEVALQVRAAQHPAVTELERAKIETQAAIEEIEHKKEEAKEEIRKAQVETRSTLTEMEKLERDAKREQRHIPPNAPWADFETGRRVPPGRDTSTAGVPSDRQEDMVYGEPVDYDKGR